MLGIIICLIVFSGGKMTSVAIPSGEMMKGFKYRIYPNKEQEKYLTMMFGQCRFVWNKLLGDYQVEYEAFKKQKENDQSLKFSKGCGGFDFAKRLTELRQSEEFQWLKGGHAYIQQGVALRLGRAFSNFFKGSGYPNFKKKKRSASFTTTYQVAGIRDGRLHLPKLKSLIKINVHQTLPTDIREISVLRTSSGKYYVVFSAKFIPEKLNGKGIIGVDLGITSLASFSTGEKIENPRHYLKNQKKLTKLQRRLSKKQKGSKNREKARTRVSRLHEKITNCRSDFMHKLTTRLVRENQAVGIESLQIKGMLKNRRLSKHIADASFGMFRSQLVYKAKWSQHCAIVAANQFYASTQICSNCKATPVVKLKLSTRNWVCRHCGTFHDRDTNAALNLQDTAKLWIKFTEPGSTFVAPLKVDNDKFPLGQV